ncbi:MAG: hypothetical protein ACOVMP_03085 [Chthoniobacterales bacterium]
MKNPRTLGTLLVVLIGCILWGSADTAFAVGATPRGAGEIPNFPTAVDAYPDRPGASLFEVIKERAAYDSFNIVGTVIFVLAIIHTFMTSTFMGISHKYAHRFHEWSLRSYMGGEVGGWLPSATCCNSR